MEFIPNPQFKDFILEKFADLVEEYADACLQVIDEPRQWSGWNPPSRGLRDIVDTGQLRDSQHITQITKAEYTIDWTTPYVGFVYYGTSRYPGRAWAEIAWQEYNDGII